MQYHTKVIWTNIQQSWLYSNAGQPVFKSTHTIVSPKVVDGTTQPLFDVPEVNETCIEPTSALLTPQENYRSYELCVWEQLNLQANENP